MVISLVHSIKTAVKAIITIFLISHIIFHFHPLAQSLSLSFPNLLLLPSHPLEASLWCPWPYKVADCWVMRCCSGAAGSPCSPLMGTLYRFQMEVGCCIQDSSLAVQGEMDLVRVTFTTNYQAVFHVDVRPVLGLQLYQLHLVQLIIYCQEMGVKWARRHILCEP